MPHRKPQPPQQQLKFIIDDVEVTLTEYSLDVMQRRGDGRYLLVATDLSTGEYHFVGPKGREGYDTPQDAINAAKEYRFPIEERWEQLLAQRKENGQHES